MFLNTVRDFSKYGNFFKILTNNDYKKFFIDYDFIYFSYLFEKKIFYKV
jgi:hypothetical protein